MSRCPQDAKCPFVAAVEPSMVKRVKYASSFPLCRGGAHARCAILPYLQAGKTPPSTLLPTGGRDSYADVAPSRHATGPLKVLVAEGSGVFRALTTQVVGQALPDAELSVHSTYADALAALGRDNYDLVVSADAFDDGKTAHDLRAACTAPMIVLSSNELSSLRPPSGTQVVARNAGPQAVRTAIAGAVHLGPS